MDMNFDYGHEKKWTEIRAYKAIIQIPLAIPKNLSELF